MRETSPVMIVGLNDGPSPEHGRDRLLYVARQPSSPSSHSPRCGPCRDHGSEEGNTGASSRFEINYATPLKTLLIVIGMGPAQSGIEVTSEQLRVQMGWAFHAHIPIRDVRHVERSALPLIAGWGVHGGAGRWLVNGSRQGVVRIEIDPAARASAMGIPVRLTTLLVSVIEPKRFIDTVNHIRVA